MNSFRKKYLKKYKIKQKQKNKRFYWHTKIIGVSIAHTTKSHTGKTAVSGTGWYKFKSEHKKGRRIGITKYFIINHVTSTRTSEIPSRINFNNETGFNIDSWLENTKEYINYGHICFEWYIFLKSTCEYLLLIYRLIDMEQSEAPFYS